MIEKMMIVKDKRSSRAESLAKEIERKMKDIDATEGDLPEYKLGSQYWSNGLTLHDITMCFN